MSEQASRAKRVRVDRRRQPKSKPIKVRRNRAGVATMDTGVELAYGVPGSGKSYILVQRILRAIQVQKRPVYTNMPLKWPVIKQYLRNRGGRELADLIRPLSQQHFDAYMERFTREREIKDQLRQAGVPSRKLTARILEEFPEPRRMESKMDSVTGDFVEHGNWIPQGAIIVIDEVHHWYPNPQLKRGGGGANKSENPHLLSFLTMHRHGVHWIWAATQAERQVSQTWKSMATQVCMVRNRSDDQVAWGIRFRHIRIPWIIFGERLRPCGYLIFPEGADPQKEKPIKAFTYYPQFKRWPFRLYTSFTHGATEAEVKKAVKEARQMAGLDEDGRTEVERLMAEPKKQGVIMRVFKWCVSLVFKLALLLGVGIIGFALGRVPSIEDEQATAAAIAEAAAVQVAGAPAAAVVLPDPVWRVTSMTTKGARTSTGGLLRVGAKYEAFDVLEVSIEHRSVVLGRAADESIWVCELGSSPKRLGAVADVVGALEVARSQGLPPSPGPGG